VRTHTLKPTLSLDFGGLIVRPCGDPEELTWGDGRRWRWWKEEPGEMTPQRSNRGLPVTRVSCKCEPDSDHNVLAELALLT